MSTAANHRKRSHRSNYRTRMFTGSRKSVIKPTIGKTGTFSLMRMLRKGFGNSKETKSDV